jgi:glycosyltransferase involved in cell wall biosynthesis
MNDVSVVIPTRNRMAWLGVALNSVLWQRDVRLEVIVVDDASVDDTRRMVTGLGEPRVRLIHHQVPGGVSAARNHGAREATGTWLAFLDDDDAWAPDKLASQVAAARASGRDWVYTGWVTIDHELKVIGGGPPRPPEEVASLLHRQNAIPTGSNVIVRREAFEKARGFDPLLTNGEDWDLWIRLAGEGLPDWVPEPLMAYRIHAGNASLDAEAMWATVATIERRYRLKVDHGSIERWIAESSLRTGHRTQAIVHLARAAAHGHARDVANDLLAALGRRVDRARGRRSHPIGRSSDAAWIAQAQAWLDDLALPPPPAVR